jgi:transcriptional regulator with XRE-family HTH domain
VSFARWYADVLRFARRDMDLSQRELARWSGVSKSTIARAELGDGQLGCETAAALLTTLGYRLTIEGPAGENVEEVPIEWRTDCVGRRFPAHLDLIPKSAQRIHTETQERVFIAAGRPGGRHLALPPSRWTFRLDRSARDEIRAHGYYGELGTVPRPPTCPDRAYLHSLYTIPWLLRGLSAPAEEAQMTLRDSLPPPRPP